MAKTIDLSLDSTPHRRTNR